jgi:hypothetical protein
MSYNMSTKVYLYDKVINERRTGVSLLNLSKKYNLSKSTVSLWCKDIKISEAAKRRINNDWIESNKISRNKAITINKNRRKESIRKEYEKAKEIIGDINNRDLLILGMGLYWAEGSKKEDGGGFIFINSDPLMIRIMCKWLFEIIGVKKTDLTINLAINISHQNREKDILNFWSNLLDFEIEDFGSTTFIKTSYKRKYSNHDNYFGMLRIKVKASSWLRRRILGMIKTFTDMPM